MKKILSLIYLSLSLILAGCTSDTIADMEQNHAGTRDFEWSNCIKANMPSWEYEDNGLSSRSSLVFDYSTKTMKVAWNTGSDKLGVFPVIDQENSTQHIFSLTDGNGLSARFVTEDEKTSVIPNTQFYAYFPCNEHFDYDYTRVPVTFADQNQSANVDMHAYFLKTNSDWLNTYTESERVASGHLSQYDYLVSSAASNSNGGLILNFTRLVSIIRFYLKVPDKIIYDSLQVVNNRADFIIDATMNVSMKDSKSAFTPTKTSHLVSIKFGAPATGFNLMDDANITANETTYNPAYNGETGYVVAYMMFAPIDLKRTDDPDFPQSTMYLIGHTAGGEKRYYRATAKLSKIDIAQNKIQQWSPAIGSDEPITFEPISVQEWTEGTTLNNGENGEGTQGW